ncbi:MAG: hypothetical protein JRJ87_10725 [Deltaproteobacteria bacterium]|nr:hypothetical protein [Deltaproteobacteria bacterium]
MIALPGERSGVRRSADQGLGAPLHLPDQVGLEGGLVSIETVEARLEGNPAEHGQGIGDGNPDGTCSP